MPRKSLKEVHPELLDEWDYEKNDALGLYTPTRFLMDQRRSHGGNANSVAMNGRLQYLIVWLVTVARNVEREEYQKRKLLLKRETLLEKSFPKLPRNGTKRRTELLLLLTFLHILARLFGGNVKRVMSGNLL